MRTPQNFRQEVRSDTNDGCKAGTRPDGRNSVCLRCTQRHSSAAMGCNCLPRCGSNTQICRQNAEREMTAVESSSETIPQAVEKPGSGDVVYFDGRFLSKSDVRVSPDDRGFLLGDGIYEVAAAYDGRFVALDRHMDRLRR